MLKLMNLKRGVVNFWQDCSEPLGAPPSGVEIFSLGESFQKRPINCYKVGNGERKLLFVSAIHGNEIGTIKLAYFLLDHLNSNRDKFSKFTCFVAPCLNPDGFEQAKGTRGYFRRLLGRLNTRDVDLNRNFPTVNFRSKSYILPKKYSLESLKYNKEIGADNPEVKKLNLTPKNCGDFGASEPETKSLVDFAAREKISLIFSFHNSGRDVMGGKDELSKELVKIYAEKTGYEIMEDEEWRKIGQTGTMKDWCDEQNISFVEVEGSTRYGSDWKIQKPALEAVFKHLAEIAQT